METHDDTGTTAAADADSTRWPREPLVTPGWRFRRCGPIVGRVTGMTLTYVRILTTVGPMLPPNSAVLAAAVGPATDWLGA